MNGVKLARRRVEFSFPEGGRWNGFDPRRTPRSIEDQQGSLFDDVD